MRINQITGAVALTAATVVAKEMKPDMERAKVYDSGLVHEHIMDLKMVRPSALWRTNRLARGLPLLTLPCARIEPLARREECRCDGLERVAPPQLHQVR